MINGSPGHVRTTYFPNFMAFRKKQRGSVPTINMKEEIIHILPRINKPSNHCRSYSNFLSGLREPIIIKDFNHYKQIETLRKLTEQHQVIFPSIHKKLKTHFDQ